MTAIKDPKPSRLARSASITFPPARDQTIPNAHPPEETSLPATRQEPKPKRDPSRATPSEQPRGKTKPKRESAALTYVPAPSLPPTPNRSSGRDTISAKAIPLTETTPPTPSPELLASIKTLGNLLDDLERVRIMNGNRVAALEREYGGSIPHLDIIAKQLRAVEHEAQLELVRMWRKHPLAPWAKSIQGVGEKSIARLIADIGDPGDRPNVAKLWAYCGVGDPARKRRKGMTQQEAFAMGNPHAKKMCWLISEAFVKNRNSPYRAVYDNRRQATANRVHDTVCVRCGPAGKPAAPGSPWSLKHQHEDGKRIAVKIFLKDLWIASRHEEHDTHSAPAGGDHK